MKRFFLLLTSTLFFLTSFSQTKQTKDWYIKLSGGRVSFGTGDFLGYSFSFDASKNVIKNPKTALARLLIGGEIIFENGVKNPVIQNPTIEEFLRKTFRHTSSTILWVKISYYPFKKIINGFNIQVGPTIGHSYRSTESKATRVADPSGSVRLSTLSFDNGFTYGYRISTGFEFNLNKKILTGFRLDFSNNNDGEINTLAGLKLGIML